MNAEARPSARQTARFSAHAAGRLGIDIPGLMH